MTEMRGISVQERRGFRHKGGVKITIADVTLVSGPQLRNTELPMEDD